MSWRRDLKESETVIPAELGWSVVSYWHDQDDDGIVCYPILAWLIVVETFVRNGEVEKSRLVEPWPITIDGVEDNPFIRSPDGRFYEVQGGSFDTEEDFLKERRRLRALETK